LVWALSDLLVQPMAGRGIFEWTRQQAEAIEAKKSAGRQPVEMSYAPGSVEWAALQGKGNET
jgi:hypothetical protein